MQTTTIPAQASALLDRLREALANRQARVETVDGARPAAVLVPLQYHNGDWHVIFNVRSQQVGSHQGEIAFPGGKLEDSDPDMLACALRETWEEMGIRPSDVDVLGSLDTVLTRTNYLVWPTVGTLPHPYEFNVNEGEVEEVIEIPLTRLVDDSAVRHEARLASDGLLLERVAYAHGEHLVFGATAWILVQLVELVKGLLSGESRSNGKELV